MKKLIGTIGLLLSSIALLTSCNKTNDNNHLEDSKYKIAINQYAMHSSLDNCYEGIVAGLTDELGENAFEITLQNPSGSSAENNQIANSFGNGDYDVLVGIATPAAEALYNSAKKTGKPVVYTAVSDPVIANLSNEEGFGNNITGTSDRLPVAKQLDLIRTVLPDAKNIGIIYTTNEKNSEIQLKEFEKAALSKGFEIISVGVSDRMEIPLAIENLLPKVDCINNTLDNNVVQSLPIILEKAKNHKIPVFGSEIEQVINGCIASEGIDYIKLGKQTGVIISRILKGEDASTIPFETFIESETYINKSVFEFYGIEVPKELLNAIEVK